MSDPREVFNRVTEDKEFNDHFTYNEVSRGMHQRKRKSIPKIPKTILEMITALENGGKISEYYNCSVNVLNSDNTAGVIFSHPALQAGFQNALEISYDGTFFTCPLLFQQVFIIMFEQGGHFFPGFVVPMTGASFNHYFPVFSKIKEMCNDKNFELSMGDFELASANAVKKCFHGINCKHCFFHFTQCIFRNLKSKGLAKKYRTREFRKWARKVMCLPLLPAEEIQGAWDELRRTGVNFPTFKRHDRANLARFKLYVDKQWMGDNFDHENLSVFQLVNATNNATESLNGYIKKLIKSKRPNIWRFLLTIYNLFKAKATDLGRLNNDLELDSGRETVSDMVRDARRASEEKLLEFKADPAVGISPMEFLHEVSTSHSDIIRGIREKIVPEVKDDNSEEDSEEEEGEEASSESSQQSSQSQTCAVCKNDLEVNWGFLHKHPETGYKTHAGFCEGCSNLPEYKVGQPCATCDFIVLAVMPITN